MLIGRRANAHLKNADSTEVQYQVRQAVLATMAFGIGINCQDIERAIQWWLLSTLEQYVQESGKGGRNGNEVNALIIVWGPE